MDEVKKVQNEKQGYKLEEDGLKITCMQAALLADNFPSVCASKCYSLAVSIFRRVWKVIMRP